MRLALQPGDDLAAVVRAQSVDSLVLILDSGWPPLVLALARAAIAPLAIEHAPATRVNAVVAGPAADSVSIEAAIGYLDHARSVTGQIIAIS